jgi:hypothetical protein
LAVILAALVPVVSHGAPAIASTPAKHSSPASASSTVGADVSYPQGAGPFMAHAAFGIIGVNWPSAAKANPFRTTDIDWALGTSGATSQPKVQLYVLAAEPGRTAASSWPTSNRAAGGATVDNPYGTCADADTAACAYMYGYLRAAHDTTLVQHPAAYRWWLDVETAETWQAKEGQTDAGAAQQLDRADLEGMVAALRARGVKTVGIYSTRYQFGIIAGTPAKTSPLWSLPNWIPIGVGTEAAARTACDTFHPLMGGKITMVQFVVGNVSTGSDHDVSCVG